MKRYPIILLLIVFGNITALTAQERLSREEYIEKYKGLAIAQMETYGIPASVKMAQALHESENGNSRLARQANNHFGIKCKSDWTGGTIDHDDDAPGECFRKYDTAEQSYLDHSEFLDKSARYQDLFKLDPSDYRGWAYGLMAAGYATNPRYAEILIKTIEDNRLYLLDQDEADIVTAQTPPAPKPSVPEPEPDQAVVQVQTVDVDNYSIAVSGRGGRHTVYHNNGSEFIISAQGDTYGSLSAALGIPISKLLNFNDLDVSAPLAPGAMVYLKTKSKRSENGKVLHIAREGDTLYSISQLYGIRLKNLCNLNRRDKNSEVKPGQQIRLM